MMTRALVQRAVLLVFLSLLLASSSPVVVRARRLDCTRFVFAPKCRGVAAKRAENTMTSEDTSSELGGTYADAIIAVGDTPKELEQSERLLRVVMDLARAIRQPMPISHTPVEDKEARESKELLGRLLRS